jgi:hypothetical protein
MFPHPPSPRPGRLPLVSVWLASLALMTLIWLITTAQAQSDVASTVGQTDNVSSADAFVVTVTNSSPTLLQYHRLHRHGPQ